MELKLNNQNPFESKKVWDEVINELKQQEENDTSHLSHADSLLQKIETEEQSYMNITKLYYFIIYSNSQLFKPVIINRKTKWDFIYPSTTTTEPRNLMYYSTNFNSRSEKAK